MAFKASRGDDGACNRQTHAGADIPQSGLSESKEREFLVELGKLQKGYGDYRRKVVLSIKDFKGYTQ